MTLTPITGDNGPQGVSPRWRFGLPAIWERFWHDPVRAERLALTRILFAAALFTDQLFQFLPHLDDFFGPEGMAQAGLFDRWSLSTWRWTMLIFNTDDMRLVVPLFWLWVAVTFAYLIGWHTRIMGVLVWFLTLCFHSRNWALLNFGDSLMKDGLFLLMIAPCGRALSLDAWLARRRNPTAASGLPMTPAWPVRLFQIQLCMIYFATGLAKLREWGTGTWWDGTSMHYVMNMVTRTRWSYAQFPVPFWMTASMTYVVVAWEILFPLLVLFRWTRKWALLFGILMHLGILLTMEIGWFSFYSIAMYGVWVNFPLSIRGKPSVPGSARDRIALEAPPPSNAQPAEPRVPVQSLETTES